jgi:tyrosyl-DNA phosphodiesterase 1
MRGPCYAFNKSPIFLKPQLTLPTHCKRRTMNEAGPSSSRKRAATPVDTSLAAQRPKHPDIIDLTFETDEDKSEKSTTANTNTINSPLYLFKVRGIPDWANKGFLGATLGDLVCGPMLWALVSDFMIDMPWLFSACPDLIRIPSLLIVHGESGSKAMAIQRSCITAGLTGGRFTTHMPPLPPYGTHHSKAFFIQYATGLRVIIHTANLLYCDCSNKTQGLYFQDFLLKKESSEQQSTLSSSPFEIDLLHYIAALKLPPLQATKVVNILKLHDFSSARVHLIASVPSAASEFSGAQMKNYGYLKLKSCLEKESGGFPSSFKGAPIACQYSSIGSLTTKWLASFIESLSAGKISSSIEDSSTSKANFASSVLGPPSGGVADASNVHLIWPTTEEVQNSIEGWFAGGSIPGYPDKVNRDFLQKFYRRFGGNVAGRQRAMPHMKSYTRFDPETQEIAWFCVASHNLSKAAWGEQQESKKFNRTIFKILSYELGVLIVPSLEKAYRQSPHYGFSCTESSQKVGPMPGSESIKQVKFRQWQRSESQAARLSSDGTVLTVPLPIPYPLPPERYAQGKDVPWAVQTTFPGLDSLGVPCPGIGTHYGVLNGMEWGDVIESLKHGEFESLLKRSF